VVRAIEAIAAFALANEGLVEELDVNPLLVFPNGAVAVDALIRMRNP
jgi:acetyl-CoA synthetase